MRSPQPTALAPVFVLLIAELPSCGIPEVPERPRGPIRWILVEKPYGRFPGAGNGEEGRIDPESRVLTFEPLFSEDFSGTGGVEGRGYFVEVLEVTPPGTIAPGEVVTVRLRAGNVRPGRAYRLVARPSTSDVRIVGEAEFMVQGPEAAVFRFTSLSGGRGGIEVRVGERP